MTAVDVICSTCGATLAVPLSKEDIELLQLTLLPHMQRKGLLSPEGQLHAKLAMLRSGGLMLEHDCDE